MLDFTSALYLGLRHAGRSLRPWAQLTTGAPAALVAPPGACAVANALAALQGCQRGTLVPSTLHLFWDLFGMLPNHGVAIYISGGTYPIARWGVERAAARGVPVRSFPHHDAGALWRQLQCDASRQLRPVVVADGLCPDCGAPAPVAAYLESVRAFGGLLILDDTQALGVLGYSPGPDAPYGQGGGGLLPWSGMGGPDVLVGSSLAKGFGVPVAVLAGSETMIGRFKAKSETRVHCSPPSLAVIHAADRALAVNRRCGAALRLRLTQRVGYFRWRLSALGLSATGGPFPVQTLAPIPGVDARALYERLLHQGIRTVLRGGCHGRRRYLSFLLTARHTFSDIDCAVDALMCAAKAAACS
jgi:8-amino-7-oxononanoate synthase